MTARDAGQALRVVMSGGVTPRIFAYDEARGILSLDDPG